MARLRQQRIAEDDSTNSSRSYQGPGREKVWNGATNASLPAALQVKQRSSPRKKALKSHNELEESIAEELVYQMKPRLETAPKRSIPAKQIRLTPLSILSSSKPLQSRFLPLEQFEQSQLQSRARSPMKPKALRKPSILQSEIAESSDSAIEVDIEENIWCGSDGSSDDSENELPSPRKLLAQGRGQRANDSSKETFTAQSEGDLPKLLNDLTVSGNDIAPPLRKPTTSANIAKDLSRPVSSSDKENAGAFLRFSPPRLYSPSKDRLKERPVTPPQSPSKSRLQSPSKTKTRIPTPPHRQSLDAFWNADTVNNWNEQHSPKKMLKSPKKLKFLQDESQNSPTTSPRKAQSPLKRTKAEQDLRKDFEAKKHSLAAAFLAELDRAVTNGRIQELSASTGGVHLIWSKTLNSTAGRANWRRETTKTRHADGTISTTHKHHASIELAEKVIDDEDRLLNVIAHEFCHLANFMISGIKGQPHGKSFNEWGRKCTDVFGDRGVNVTTKHSYQIEYKYVWQCSNEECAVEFKRHSKSVDPKRHTCGTCRGRLVQVKPVPRKDAGGGSGYAAFVKSNFAGVKKGMPGASQKEVMEAVGRKYRAEKAGLSKSSGEGTIPTPSFSKVGTATEIDKVARVLEFITLDDD